VILCLVEHDGAGPSPLSLQALALGRRLAGALGVHLEAVLVGDEAKAIAGSLDAQGVATVRLVRHERLDAYAPAAWARALSGLIDAGSARAVLAAGTDRGNEVLAHLGAMRDLPFAANCTEVTPAVEAGAPWAVSRIRWGGSLLEDARLHADVALVSVAPHAVPAEEVAATAPEVEEVTPPLEERDLRVRISGREEAEGGGVSLPEARVVIGGGRGVGSAEGFRVLEELAGLLGGVVGGSRVVTSLGWRPHSDQIGQTGTRIAPDLYIACGISGAIQHMVGCKAAKRILAINSDPDAPIVAKADYAVIGDLHQVLPALIAEIRAAAS
jgi:electron transfer flavoprotein alpha subunit